MRASSALTGAQAARTMTVMLARRPRPPLQPFVRTLWACDETTSRGGRERVLPGGTAHVVFRLDVPLRVYDGDGDRRGRIVGHVIVGGPRAGAYVRDVSFPVTSVGAELAPGAAALLLGERADALAHRHTPLADLWGRTAELWHEQLLEAGDPERRLTVFEALLFARLPRLRGVHPAVAHALARFGSTSAVREVVAETGYSHRRFGALFQEAVGLAPKRYCRVLRFRSVLDRLATEPSTPMADIALAAGYSDQPHFTREFRELAGMSPGAYRKRVAGCARHVPVG
jgi:AraC-like DNA-binding protein